LVERRALSLRFTCTCILLMPRDREWGQLWTSSRVQLIQTHTRCFQIDARFLKKTFRTLQDRIHAKLATMGDSKISVHSLNDLKNTTDDCLGNYLRGLGFAQDNSKLDIRLAVGYTSVVIAAVTFVADYKLGWEATKTGTAVAVAAYAILNGVYTYWMWLVEKGLVFEGERQGKKVSVLVINNGNVDERHAENTIPRYRSRPERRSTTRHTT
jgi:hypothetical protein